MKIFILPTSYPDAKHPHKDIFIYEQAKQLAKQGNEIVVLHIVKLPSKQVFTKAETKIKKCDDAFAIRYTAEIHTMMETRFPQFSREEFVKCAERLFLQAVEEHGFPDVIYAHFSCWAGYAGVYLRSKYQVPLVTIEHNSTLMKRRISKTLKQAVATSLEASEAFVCVSLGLRNSIIRHLKTDKELLVVSNMIDGSFAYCKRIEKAKFVFCAIGNLNPRKDFETLILSFEKAFSRDDNVELRIGGDGSERKKLERMVKKLGREKQIVFLGHLTREDTLREYKNCDCFALASRFETYGLVYREAMAIGRPIVTTDHGGFSPKEWKREYGYIVPVNNIELFSNALKNIKEYYSCFNGKMISELCLQECSSDYIGGRIEEILFRAIEKNIIC